MDRRRKLGVCFGMLRRAICATLALGGWVVHAQYCPVGSTYFAANVVAGCTVGSCWSSTPFPGSTATMGSSYPAPNYACAMPSPPPGALENTLYGYDRSGNLTTIRDPIGRTTTNAYDALARMTQLTDATGKPTRYGYDANGALKQVTDPRGLVTQYTLDGFGEMTATGSPDTGITTRTFDAAGNLVSQVDARGATATYTYDALNRVTRIVRSRLGAVDETHVFTWDSRANGVGRLSRLEDPAGTTTWTYDAQGRATSKTQIVGGRAHTTTYGYNRAGQLESLTTPSGQRIGFTYRNNRVAGVTVNSIRLVADALTQPFGPVDAWQWGNAHYTFRDYDADGRLSRWEFRNGVSILRQDLAFDAAGRVAALSDSSNPALASAYQYDALDRLAVAQRGSPITSTRQFAYDATGNRLNDTRDGTLTNLGYAPSSNQLTTVSGAIPDGYLFGARSVKFTYNNANRLVQVELDGVVRASYLVNALGQRVQKTVGGIVTRFFYDERGRLLGEYDATGALIQETIWLEDLPIATLRPAAATGTPMPMEIYYVHADHLGTPRAITRPSDNRIVWRWDNVDPFGANAANEDPSGLGPFSYALRFPGQYYDAETGMHYNYFRDYDPMIGRYVQSDPIGLVGGYNTYQYGSGDPLSHTDPMGLFKFHGQWCGPNWTGGFEKPWDRLTDDERRKVRPPEDALDSCCQVHDKCHADCRDKFPCDMDQQKRCLEGCDRRLYFCSRQSGVGSFLLEDYMRRSNATPEKGACCPN